MTAQSTFAFRARDAQGEIASGTMTAASSTEVSARLRAEGKFPISIDANAMRSSAVSVSDAKAIRKLEASKRVRREDVIAFCQQLGVMLETGVSIVEAMDAFSQQMPQREFRAVLASVNEDIHAGESLSSSLMKWPRVFPNLMISLTKASEASGTMSTMLGRVGEYLAKERKTARQIRGALGYPLFMISAGIVMTIFLMIFVLPRFAAIYEQNAATLPLPTLILLGVSDVVRGYYLYYGPILLGAGTFLFFWAKGTRGRYALDWLRLNIPVLGGMFRQLYLTRAARTMATLLAAGVNLLDIIEICRGVTNNVCFDRLWTEMEQGIRGGRQISDAVRESPYVPPNVSSMIVSGERSGRLPDVMERIAAFAEEELENTVKKTTAMIEPAMIIMMGFIIGGVALALLL
ncbi:MAG: type II secretion system F family protein, partial [Phycisphaerales bacterium]|nr:type II secretion system F family protein [Phycisphaerales bacterium]